MIWETWAVRLLPAGTGAFGVVHRCRERRTGNVFAAKFIPCRGAMERELIRKEIDIMNQLHHRKLINLHDAFEDDDEMVLIFELWVFSIYPSTILLYCTVLISNRQLYDKFHKMN